MFRTLRAVLAQHKRLSDVEATCRDLAHQLARLAQSCEELRADLDFTNGDIKKLRGRVTGGSRRTQPEPEPDGRPAQLDINEAIKAGRFVRPRR